MKRKLEQSSAARNMARPPLSERRFPIAQLVPVGVLSLIAELTVCNCQTKLDGSLEAKLFMSAFSINSYTGCDDDVLFGFYQNIIRVWKKSQNRARFMDGRVMAAIEGCKVVW